MSDIFNDVIEIDFKREGRKKKKLPNNTIVIPT
jgi:hypothetical protein